MLSTQSEVGCSVHRGCTPKRGYGVWGGVDFWPCCSPREWVVVVALGNERDAIFSCWLWLLLVERTPATLFLCLPLLRPKVWKSILCTLCIGTGAWRDHWWTSHRPAAECGKQTSNHLDNGQVDDGQAFLPPFTEEGTLPQGLCRCKTVFMVEGSGCTK